MKILEALAKFRAIGTMQPKRNDVMVFSGNSNTPEGFKKTLGNLRKHKKFVEFHGNDAVSLTDEGIAQVGHVDPSNISNEAYHDAVKEMLSKKGGEIFDELADGREYDKIDVATKMGYNLSKLSGFNKDLGRMNTLGLLNKTKDTIQLSDKCFPKGGRPKIED